MRAALILAAAFGLAAAAPRPQEIDLDALLAAYEDAVTTMTEAIAAAATDPPSSIAYDQTSAIVSVIDEAPTATASASAIGAEKVRRDAICPTQATGAGPKPTDAGLDDTAAAFLGYDAFSSIASAAPATATGGFTQSFVNLQGSNSQLGYLTYYTLSSYDVNACAAKCNKLSQCAGFNIFFERAPTVDPNDASCKNPPSTTLIKCSVYGFPVYGKTATNTGQWRNKFQVVIAGSNGYSKFNLPAAPTNFTNPTAYVGAIRSYQSTDQKFITARTYTTPVDVKVCAALCQATTLNDFTSRYPVGNPNYDPCNFFNIWIAVTNDVPTAWTCSMYVAPPVRSGMDDNYGQGPLKVVNSIGYSLTVQDPGHD